MQLYKAKPKEIEKRDTELFDTPSLPKELSRKLEQYELLRDFINDSLPLALAPLFVRARISGETLHIDFSHPAAKKEFEGKREDILKEMRRIYKERSLKEHFRFSSVKASMEFVPLQKEEVTPKEYRFPERSDGQFDISDVQDQEIRQKLEEIKKIIKEKK